VSEEYLNDSQEQFNEQFKKRLEGLCPEEQRQFLRGLFLGLDTIVKLAWDPVNGTEGLSLPELLDFLMCQRSSVYTAAVNMGLDENNIIKTVIESQMGSIIGNFQNVASTHIILGNVLDETFERRLTQLTHIAELDAMENK
jgi:hypothetical protein